jgi:hypothetical protein
MAATYRSLDGTGNFNWRMDFGLDYLPVEGCIVVNKKEHVWSLETMETKLKPQLCLQVWDNDMFSSDDFLGQITLDLNSMPQPAKSASSCNIQIIPGLKTNELNDTNASSKGFSLKNICLPTFPLLRACIPERNAKDFQISSQPPPSPNEKINIFEKKRTKGFYPFVGELPAEEGGGATLAGKAQRAEMWRKRD